jgi:hypothetical protein
MSVRYFTPSTYGNGYRYNGELNWLRDDVDLREEEGYYLPSVDGGAVINNQCVKNLSYVSHYIHVLMTALGEPIEPVYGISERTQNSKWFEKAIKDEQWVNIEEYLKKNEDVILHGKGGLVAKAAKFFDGCNKSDFHIGITFAEKLLPLLKNKDGVMFKLCSEISSNFRDMNDLVTALNYFGMGKNLRDDCDVDFVTMFNNMDITYPLIKRIRFIYGFSNNEKNALVDDNDLQLVADYVNLVDGQPKQP